MAEPKNDDFLDDIEAALAEELRRRKRSQMKLPRLMRCALNATRLQDKFMRALADAENARKRSDKDRLEAANYGGSKLGPRYAAGF